MSTTIDRNPDINLDIEEIPADCYLATGKFLMPTARAAKIPYGVAFRVVPCGHSQRSVTEGLVIRLADQARFDGALANKNSNKKKSPVAR